MGIPAAAIMAEIIFDLTERFDRNNQYITLLLLYYIYKYIVISYTYIETQLF